MFVNSYLLETADGVVLVDAGLLVSDARALAARIAALHKPLAAAFVTHPHPDHFNGLPYVVADEIHALAAERDPLRRDDGHALTASVRPWPASSAATASAPRLISQSRGAPGW